MEKLEAKMIVKEFLEKAFDIAYESLCIEHNSISFSEEEIDLITTSVIRSAIDTSNELQDRLLKVLQQHQK